MCGTCGCSDKAEIKIEGQDRTHSHILADGTVITHSHDHGDRSTDTGLHDLEIQILQKNDRLAERNRGYFAGRSITAINLMSSPGAGKTTLLEKTLSLLNTPAAVLEGDQETASDAERIRATGVPAVQINTGRGCHLEADMVWKGLQSLNVEPGSLLFIENVGNLVCPAMFDLGEHARVVLFSVTEGEDKPLKYPHMFRVADQVLLTKLDLLPYLEFDVSKALQALERVCPKAELIRVSAHSGEGMDAWRRWLLQGTEGYHACAGT